MKSKLTTMTIILTLIASIIYAQNIPQKISFQGRLIDANTQKPVTAEKNFTFKIGDWIEEHTKVQVSNGLYSVILGSINPIPLDLFNDWQANMKILVDGKEMAPDIEMVSVPYAFETVYSKSLNGNLKVKNGKCISWLNKDNSNNSWLVSNTNGLTYQFLKNGAGGGNTISVFKTDDEKNVKSFSIGNYTLYGENNKGFQLLDVYGGAYIGIVNPEYALHVEGASVFRGNIGFVGTHPNSYTVVNDGFRFRYNTNFFGKNYDAMVFEKTDGNAKNPDGGIAFVNRGSDGIQEAAMVIRGYGKVGIGTKEPNSYLHVQSSDINNTNLVKIDFTGGNVGNNDSSSALLRILSNSSYRPLLSLNDKCTFYSNGNIQIYGNESPRVVEITGKRSVDSNGTFPGIVALSWHNNNNAVSDIHFGKLGRVTFGGNHTDNSYSNILYVASIEGVSEGTFINSENMPTGIAFFTGKKERSQMYLIKI